MKTLKLVLAALLFVGIASARADDVVILERAGNDFDTWGASPGGREHVLTAISRETGVPITDLEAQQARTRLGFGGLFIANSLASATGKTFDEIAALKESGHGWGWIAKENNVKLGPIVSSARHANKANKPAHEKVKKVKKNKHFDDAFERPSHGHGNGHGEMKGPKGAGNFHSNGHGKGH
jgi:hypothetical protein